VGGVRFGSAVVRCIGREEGRRIGGLGELRIVLGELRSGLEEHHIDLGEHRTGLEELRIGVEVVRIRYCLQLKEARRVSDRYLLENCMLHGALCYRG
jgi:hypothetical protein